MLSPSYFLTFTYLLSSIVTCTPFEYQKLLKSMGIASKPKIPGGSTFKYCSVSDPDNDIFAIDRIVWEPNPPRISRLQKLFIYGIFSQRIPFAANGTGEIYIPEWHDPYSPASNYTETGPFCQWPNFVYQSDEERGVHKVCDGALGGNYSAPEAGPAVWVSEDVLFWPLPEGEYEFRLDMLMPGNKEGSVGKRIFCLEAKVNLDY